MDPFLWGPGVCDGGSQGGTAGREAVRRRHSFQAMRSHGSDRQPLARVMEPIAAAGAVLHASDAASQTQVTNALLNWEPLAAVAASSSPLHAAQQFPSNWGGPFFFPPSL